MLNYKRVLKDNRRMTIIERKIYSRFQNKKEKRDN